MPELLERVRAALAERYAIEDQIGRGGMGAVYLAHDLRHRRPVAIKILDPELARSLGAERFLREIELTANLNHPHTLPLHHSGEAGGLLYYVMPYVAGETLRTRRSREGQLPLDDALRITREVAAALGHAHSHNEDRRQRDRVRAFRL
jgi:serine/threonine protein kinase